MIVDIGTVRRCFSILVSRIEDIELQIDIETANIDMIRSSVHIIYMEFITRNTFCVNRKNVIDGFTHMFKLIESDVLTNTSSSWNMF